MQLVLLKFIRSMASSAKLRKIKMSRTPLGDPAEAGPDI